MVSPALNKVIRIIAGVIVLGVVGHVAVLCASDDAFGLREKLAAVAPTGLLLPIGFSLLSYACRFFRWRYILRRFGHNIPITTDAIFYLSGFALTMTPGKSGETIRSAFLLYADVPVSTSFSAFVIERFFDLLIVAILASLFFISPFLTLMLLGIALALIGWVGMHLEKVEQLTNTFHLPALVKRLLSVFSQSSAALDPKSVLLYAILGSLAWIAQGAGFYFVVCLFSDGIGLYAAISTYCAGLIVGAASMVPGGLGVTEGSLVWLLNGQGLDKGVALLAALLSRLCTLWLAVAIGCAALAVIIKGYGSSPIRPVVK